MRKALSATFWSLLALLSCAASVAEPTGPEPFVATYAVTFRGISGGTLRMELRPDPQPGQPARYVFETRANPTTLARLFVSSDAVERSVLEVAPDGGLRPLSWFADDAKSGNKGDGKLQFDWNAQKVTGEVEGKPVSLTTEPGLQDRMSMQASVIWTLQRGKQPGTIMMVNEDHTRSYTYTSSGNATVDTPLGKVDTIIYESTRANSNRLSRVWHAPSLGYIPVRMEQIRKGKVETVMTLQTLEKK